MPSSSVTAGLGLSWRVRLWIPLRLTTKTKGMWPPQGMGGGGGVDWEDDGTDHSCEMGKTLACSQGVASERSSFPKSVTVQFVLGAGHWALGTGPRDEQTQCYRSSSLYVQVSAKGNKAGSLIKHELWCHKFLHLLTQGHAWSVYGEGENLG